MYVDSHVHYWQLARGDYGWLKPSNPLLYQDYLPDRLSGELGKYGVEAVIAVQAAPTFEEATYLLELSGERPEIAGVIGGLDPLTAGFQEELAALCANRRFRGIRVGGSVFDPGLPDHDRKKVLSALGTCKDAGLVVELLVDPRRLAEVAATLAQLPGLTVVVDHLGCPAVKERATEQWMAGMERLSELPGVYVKLSGMMTMAGGRRPELLRPYTDRLHQWYGASRLLFGSDWPVALQAGGYVDVVDLFEELLPDTLTFEEKGWIRAGNAKRIYGIEG
ncbi:L-fuconolactonase [Paenibacillus phyllosphaerae]|uniref:L-fuconolactonase n=1 Tax=Paenibacillus phyllosphaerae TaxID=274593 RepID=A0A7W5B578_9BACL|nr:amidohydrolase family protein [Paenibacillus phyllosphaerae]MBB3114482.1 L-fuconolactonase [Paenibacillus phyllosphaerae]